MMDVTPSPAEIVQTEQDFDLRPFPVYVQGVAETREMPAKQGGYTTYTGTPVAGVQVLSYEPRRKSATITSDQALWIGSSQQSVMVGGFGAFKSPANAVITIGHMDEVWAAPVTGTADISIMTTFWSE